MARSLSIDLNLIQTSPKRQPAYKVEVYDVRSTSDTIGDIVRGLTLNPTTGPRDFSADVLSVQFDEQISDIVDAVSSNVIGLVVADPNGVFDPFNAIADPTGDGRWLRRGNVVRIREGDSRVDDSLWPVTFTGKLVGQAGTLTSRDPESARRIVMQAVGREADFLRYKNTSRSFDIGTTYLAMGTDIAQSDMALDADEIDFAGWGATTAGQPVQFVDEPPMVSLARLMFVDGFVPRFDGEGKLTQSQAFATGVPDRIYTDDGLISAMDRPFSKIDPPNSVVVKGLSSVMTKVVQPRQRLAELTITTGFFTQDETIDVFWSEDKTILAQNVSTEVVRSVNGGLSVLGGGESFSFLPSPNGLEGFIGVTAEFSTGYAPWLIVFLTATYVALSWVPDQVVTVPLLGQGFTINVGSAAAAAALAAALIIMTKIGRGNYQFMGEPFEYVFAEIVARAEIDGTLSQDVVELVIENHLVNTQADADDLARDVLFEQQAKGNPRSFVGPHDLVLEPNDTFEVLSGRLFKVKRISRTLQRGLTAPVATMDALEITPGIAP